MCGIAGIWNRDGWPFDEAVLGRFTRSLAHLGPDGDGIYVDGALGLGHRRLAVIDPSSAGHQPMQYGNGRWWITFNGELHNFLELRAELEARGHALALLLCDPAAARRMGNAGRAHVVAHFSHHAFGARLEAILRDVIQQRTTEQTRC